MSNLYFLINLYIGILYLFTKLFSFNLVLRCAQITTDLLFLFLKNVLLVIKLYFDYNLYLFLKIGLFNFNVLGLAKVMWYAQNAPDLLILSEIEMILSEELRSCVLYLQMALVDYLVPYPLSLSSTILIYLQLPSSSLPFGNSTCASLEPLLNLSIQVTGSGSVTFLSYTLELGP